MDKLSKKKAYQAMYYFLDKYYKLTKSDDVGCLLGGMSLLNDGGTADPAIWQDWEDAISKALERDSTDINLKFVK